jgi:polyisoprenoid-binding protein YceI
MSLFGRRRRRTLVGGESFRDANHALMPIPPTGGLVSCQLRNVEGRPLPGVTVTVTENDGLRRVVTESRTDPFGFFTSALPSGGYTVRAVISGYRALAAPVEIGRGDHAALGAITLAADHGATRPTPGEWVIDDAHSRLGFVARHIALSRVYGQFTRFRGSIRIAEDVEDSGLDVVIDASSIETHNATRDAHLRSADFLDVDNHPQLQFSSTRFVVKAGNSWAIDGDLTIRGRTNDVRLDTTYLGTQTWNGTRIGATATAALHREHFTLNWQQMVARGVPVVGSTIQLHLDVQAVLQL